ncbi:hypothetical protein A3C26_02825 [Candidatus Daviesbacteria bacterium RIFCSPHIGHO2_02_FULL_39_12]|uniref:SWIM-type domain-containing protein n=1 Tax=Candidatus Daviesbacteria bacterium RIFCSPHIGHO2_02_FULL_39_12 TaxID=1797770 RepID=A0A1F5JCE9_9BACT|nr:MAG: hypothetical protein A3C26_02825 [Candidatus Daviesbacteria bacterium RIFCSPHIGHO2_02_FULL_39_12]
MQPTYDLDKIKFATDGPTFEKAVGLYESGKVTQFEEGIGAYSAIVQGSQPYRVLVEACRYDCGHCECYLGQNDTLCKHMVAVAIYAVSGGKPLSDEDKRLVTGPTCSGRLGVLTKKDLSAFKKAITTAMRHIKPYIGPARIWFAYQNSLSEGCNRLSAIVSDLPVSKQTAWLLVDMLLRLDKKLSTGGVDDSEGTVGGFIEETVNVLKEYTRVDSSCKETFRLLEGRETSFGWEGPLLALVKNPQIMSI